ncbi:MAG TPA: DUF4249 domain-containing protein [Mucilaginibacter sp.]|nr:DUF4249 domain-containing protein [Mucilaginibacter sp.]
MIVLSVACKKPYNPPVINSPQSYLVVEGTINTKDTTTIKISRTVKLSQATALNPVEATVAVESSTGDTYGLGEIAPGVYKLVGVQLDDTKKFRIDIVTQDDHKQYRSDFVQAKNSPPIDSIGFNLTSNGIQLYANAHDASNSTRYYRYDYLETWKFHSLYNSAWKSDGVAIVPRNPSEQIYYCFKSEGSNSIVLGSTAKLTQDVLYQTPITSISSTSEKIELKYSILVRQYALTAEAYKFWETLKKNTEQLGSIFDAEPTQLAGNIHNISDAQEIVIGYISAGATAEKRIFISSEQLPESYKPTYPYACSLDSSFYSERVSGVNTVDLNLVPGIEIPVSAFYGPLSPKPIGFTGSDKTCVDCTLRGSRQQPDFWK